MFKNKSYNVEKATKKNKEAKSSSSSLSSSLGGTMTFKKKRQNQKYK